MAADTIISPFDAASKADLDDFVSFFREVVSCFRWLALCCNLIPSSELTGMQRNRLFLLQDDDDDELELTRENVEMVLDEMRPYLQADG